MQAGLNMYEPAWPNIPMAWNIDSISVGHFSGKPEAKDTSWAWLSTIFCIGCDRCCLSAAEFASAEESSRAAARNRYTMRNIMVPANKTKM